MKIQSICRRETDSGTVRIRKSLAAQAIRFSKPASRPNRHDSFTILLVRGIRIAAYRRKAVGICESLFRHWAKAHASSIACAPPWPRFGAGAWAASPKRTIRPDPQPVTCGTLYRSRRMMDGTRVPSRMVGIGAMKCPNKRRSSSLRLSSSVSPAAVFRVAHQ